MHQKNKHLQKPATLAPMPTGWRIDRRDFLKASAASLFGFMAGGCALAADRPPRPALRFGILTDSHYADAEAKGTRFYRESLGKVLAVFQGHDHPGAHTVRNGIHYYTLKAIVEGSGAENNAYAVVEVHPDLFNLTVTGYRRAVSLEMARADRHAGAGMTRLG